MFELIKNKNRKINAKQIEETQNKKIHTSPNARWLQLTQVD